METYTLRSYSRKGARARREAGCIIVCQKAVAERLFKALENLDRVGSVKDVRQRAERLVEDHGLTQWVTFLNVKKI